MQAAATIANVAREGAIYSGVTSGASFVPLVANIVDAGAHLINSVLPYLTSNAAAGEQEQAEHNQRATAKLN